MLVRSTLALALILSAALLTLLAAPPEAALKSPAPSPEEKIAAALQQRVSLEVGEMPLAEVVALWQKQAGVPVQIDEKALADVGIATDTPVTQNLKDLRLVSVLRWTLHNLDLTYTIRDEVLLITTPEEANAHLKTVVYPVKDLVAPDEPYESGPGARYDFDTLIDLIVSTVAPTSWDDGTGQGPVYAFGTSIVVEQNDDVQLQIAELLAMLRRSRALWEKWDGKTSVPQLLDGRTSLATQSADEQRIYKVLQEPAEWNVREAPLAEFLLMVAEKHTLPIVIDRKAFADVGFDVRTRVTQKAEGVSLASALRLLLRPLALNFCVRDDALAITTEDEVKITPRVRLYPVFDLIAEELEPAPAMGLGGGFVGGGWGVGGPGFAVSEERPVAPVRQEDDGALDVDSMHEVITRSVHPSAWDDTGGPCNCSHFPACRGFVISATDEVHEGVEQLLARLRKVTPMPLKLTAELVTKHQAELVRRVYLVAADTPERSIPEPKELADVVRSQVAPQTWKDAAHSIVPLRGRLVVTAPRSVQRKVAELLVDLRVAPEAKPLPPQANAPGGAGL